MKYENVINLMVGDWSNDGHGRTETITISSNFNKEDIEKAYKEGSKKLKVDLTKELCCAYEDVTIPLEVWENFANAGFKLEDLFTDEEMLKDSKESLETEGELWICADEFAKLYLFIIKQGNSSFEYTIEENDNINIGGYGLFF